jgi:hypothetical protein
MKPPRHLPCLASIAVGLAFAATVLAGGRALEDPPRAGKPAEARSPDEPPPPAAASRGRRIWIAPHLGVDRIFAPGAKWERAKTKVDVFKFYVDPVRDYPPEMLARAVATLRAAGIAIAVEAGGLRGFQCDGRKMANLELRKLEALFRAGGRLDFLVLDAPFGYSLATGSRGNCGYTPERAVRELVAYVETVRARLPEVRIGIIEPVPWYEVEEYGTSLPNVRWGDLLEILALLLDALEERGERLDFFHADSPYSYNERLRDREGWEKLRTVQEFVQARGVRFGLIYNTAMGGGSSDRQFFVETMRGLARFEQAGGEPDDFVVQTWYRHPEEVLPENKTYTFFYLVNKFADRLER